MTSVHCWLRLLKIAAPFTPKQNPDDANSANSAPPGLEGGGVETNAALGTGCPGNLGAGLDVGLGRRIESYPST